MLPYSRGLILDNSNNYGIVKTEAVFGFGPTHQNNYVNDSFKTSEPVQWIITQENFERRSVEENAEARESKSLKITPKVVTAKQASSKTSKEKKSAKKSKQSSKKHKRKGKGVKKCIFKILHKGKKRKKNRGNQFKMSKKYMLPVILGLLAAKSLLIPIALKALAFLSAKGLMMAFFSTVMASVLSLKGMFQNQGYQNRKDDTKTQVEIFQVPSKSEDHVYYDDHYRRGDLVPFIPYETEEKFRQNHKSMNV